VKTERTVVNFPASNRLERLADQYHRLRWYAPKYSGVDAYLFCVPGLEVDRHDQ